ncbi:hypothetical protein IPN41_01885 [Candidatus Falkowbacteria bacterium]|nr:MAG: hypothetical protein IPN41_01885 [Candidatus Falkowbacteria bacterium]
MAFEGTHLRFAVDVQERFQIQDLNKYLSGTIYPDSRYMTKIERNLTHGNQFFDKNFYQHNDFKKGWVAHLIYDKIQFELIGEIFSDIVPQSEIFYGDENWITRTAIKMLQDMNDISNFEIQIILPLLNYVETPNGENLQTLERYNQLIIDLYHSAPSIHINDYKKMQLEYSGDETTFDKVAIKVSQFRDDTSIKERVPLLYPKTVDIFSKQIL